MRNKCCKNLSRCCQCCANSGLKIHALQPLALAAVSVHAFLAVAHAHVNAQLFCLVFSHKFNIMSTHFLHQA